AAALWPTTFNVRAPARAEGALQQVLAAPFDGFVGTVHLRPGEPVRAGQVLLTLQEADLALQRDTRAADLAQHEKAYREAMTGEDAAAIVVARARLAQAQAEFELVQRQLDRAQIRAPFDGVLLAGDFTQALGAPVKRGQELMTVAPDRGWRVVVEVDEQDVAAVKPGQQARVMFAAAAEPVQMTVTRVAPVATPSDGRNAFEVEGEVTAGAAALRPGLRGFARIEVGERTLGAIWLHRIGNGVRRLLWRVLG
nr:HlyD family efflux transporter periplasmic adaptor subunit [Burkholderiaceae bacterium]